MIHPFFEQQAALFSKHPGVWNHTPPSDYQDRMANEGAPATPAGGYPLTNHGGSTIPNPKLVIVYLGPWWGDVSKLEAFAADLMDCGYLAPLTAYGSGQGSFVGAFHGPTVSGTVTDAQLQAALKALIAAPPSGFPLPNGRTLYALLLPDGVTVTEGGSASCSAFCGYHSNLDDSTFYTVQLGTSCQGCNEGDPFVGFTAVLAHEVAEACTDAVPGSGWFNDQTGMENADIWAWVFGPYGPWTLQGYQVNGVGNSLSVIKYAQPTPAPQPQPGPNPQPNPKAKADAVFAADKTALAAQQAGDHTGGNVTRASAYAFAMSWLKYTQGGVDAVLTGTTAGVATTSPVLEAETS